MTEDKPKKWEPKTGAKYYVISGGHILKGVHKRMWVGSELDFAYYNSENFFRSKKEAMFIYNSFNGGF